jgi:hypothetical protein
MQSANDRTVLLETLKKQQSEYHEGSFEWANIQAKIDQIIAENFLQYVNR